MAPRQSYVPDQIKEATFHLRFLKLLSGALGTLTHGAHLEEGMTKALYEDFLDVGQVLGWLDR